MHNFEPIGAKVKFAPLIYYKNYNNKPLKNMFTVYDDEAYGQNVKVQFLLHAFTLLMDLNGVTKQ